MVEMPRRSVTRFFIPMIDVLTLLFSLYLLMPIVSSVQGESEQDRIAREERLRQLENEIQLKSEGGESLTAKLREEIEQLRREKIAALKSRLRMRVLEIDPKDGSLFYRDPELIEIDSSAKANRLIASDAEEHGVAPHDLYYLILYPRERFNVYPTADQRETYDTWFKRVALDYDIPGKKK